MNKPILYTDSIRLRAPEPEDLEILIALENDEELWENGISTGPYSRFQLKRYIAENTNDIYTDGQLRLIIENASGKAVGIIDLFAFDVRHRRAEVGIAILKDYRRQGVARTAMLLLEQHCFGFLGIHQLYAYVQESNIACRNLFLSSGYVVTGILKDWIYIGCSYKNIYVMQKISSSVT